MATTTPVTHFPERRKRAHWSEFLRNINDRDVAVGELALINSGPALTCRAIGSTVAVCFHVPRLTLSGILHVAFPEARQHKALGQTMPLAFADRGVAELVRVLGDMGAELSDVQVALVGGSGLMSRHPVHDGPSRLTRAVEVTLMTRGLVVATRHIGGSRARSVHQTTPGQLLVMMTGGQP